jgi:hypothetical protein
MSRRKEAIMGEIIAIGLITAYVAAMIILARAILTRMDRHISHEDTRKITIEMPLGDDRKLLRLEQRLLNRGATILDLDYHCDMIHDRERVTLLVARPDRREPAVAPHVAAAS